MEVGGQPHAEKIEALLGHYVEQRLVHGVTLDPEELCRDAPQLLTPLRACIEEYEHLERVLAPPQTLAPGQFLLHYRIVAKIGEGGMGEVYLAEDRKLGRRLALKVLPAEMAGRPERLERFRREARAVAALNHPNIVTLYSIEETEGIHLLTMELVTGTTLTEKIPAHGMPLDQLLDLSIPVADALAAAHERRIAHRDLKPDNVMVDDEGRVKMLDFGLAKLIAKPVANDSETLTATLTQAGGIVGTVPYMSPEQVLGRSADARSDIFSFGVMLYQMATGRRPFRGEASAELISAILRDTPTPIDELRAGLPCRLGRIVQRCLEKAPEHRYPSALDLRDELVDLKREVITGEVTLDSAALAAARRPPTKWRWPIAVVAAGLLALAGAYHQLRPREGSAGVATQAAGTAAVEEIREPTALAVLYFENLTGDPDLDWLRHGITTMLVTDLSQSPDLAVLNTGRLYKILKDLNALEETVLSSDLVRGFGEHADIETVVRGSYARVGEVLRISISIEDPTSGEILKSHSIEERGEESLFAMVDQLSASIRDNFEVGRPAESPATVRVATTSSLEAWRLYTEGMNLAHRSNSLAAITALEKALAIDPSFALALDDLGRIHGNIGHAGRAREYKRRAFEQKDRLPLPDRYRVEASYYAARWATTDRAIETYREGLRLYPDQRSWRNNLARRYAYLERYQEAIAEFEVLIARGTTHAAAYSDVANAYAALGRFEIGHRVLLERASIDPDNWLLHFALGWHLIEWHKLEAADQHLADAAALHPGHWIHYGRWRLQVLREDWQQADLEARTMATFEDSFAHWRGSVSLARNLLFRGRSKEALAMLEEALGAYRGADAATALTRCWKAELLLELGRPDEALEQARLAQEQGREEWPELMAMFVAALAEQQLGRPSAADAILETLRERWLRRPNTVQERQLDHLAGRLALARGEPEAAVEALRRAASLLPPRGVEFHWHVYPDHVPVWFALGQAELAAGLEAAARRSFELATASGSEHIEQPIPFVRSFYLLSQIHRRRGETSEADRLLERFHEYWNDGGLNRHPRHRRKGPARPRLSRDDRTGGRSRAWSVGPARLRSSPPPP